MRMSGWFGLSDARTTRPPVALSERADSSSPMEAPFPLRAFVAAPSAA
jgi:hypothetical protein